MEYEDAYENYQNKADDFEIEIEEVIINIDSIILKPETPPVIHPFIPQVVPSLTSHQNHSIKLPQIDIKKFSVDVTEWQLLLLLMFKNRYTHFSITYLQINI